MEEYLSVAGHRELRRTSEGSHVPWTRWVSAGPLLIGRELLLRDRRGTACRRGLHGISQNVRAQRLRELEAAGIVTRTKAGARRRRGVYS